MRTPEVILLRPHAESTHAALRMVNACAAYMVEMGFHFALSDDEELPERTPEDLKAVKLILIDEHSWEHYQRGPDGERLRRFASAGGLIFKLDVPATWSNTDEHAIRNPLEMMAANAALTPDEPTLRQRLQSRGFESLYRGRGITHLQNQLASLRSRSNAQIWGEPTAFGLLQTLEHLHRYDDRGGWDAALSETLEFLLDRPPVLNNLDPVAGMESFIRHGQRTGEHRWIAFASGCLSRMLDRKPRIDGALLHDPSRDRLVWTECSAMAAPSLTMLGVALSDERYTALAISTARAVHRLCYDPAKKLYFHGGRPGYRTPAIWGRGQAWAVLGLVGILRHLPVNHPDRETIRGWLAETLEGLLTHQTEEGLWRNIVDDPASRHELRGSCMIGYAYAEAWREKWVSHEKLPEMLRLAWTGIRGRVWNGLAASSAAATGVGFSYQYYLSRPQVFYGLTDVLHAGAAIVDAVGEMASATA